MDVLHNGANSTGTQRIKLINAVTKLVFAFLTGCSLLFFSIKTATANDTKKFDFPEKLTEKSLAAVQNSNGRYMMTLSSVVIDQKAHWYTLVWDTKTGRSKIYYSNVKDGLKRGHSDYDLPSPPL